jgi:hypothetical protein
LTIRETQRRTWGADGSLTVTSEPLLDFMGGSRFTTCAAFVVRPHEAGGCVVRMHQIHPHAAPPFALFDLEFEPRYEVARQEAARCS